MIALVRTEGVKAIRRARTAVIAFGLVALPTLIAFAIHSRRGRGEREGGLFFLARGSGLYVPAVALEAMSGFLLVIVAAMIAGDSVAGDSASGNLRYLLVRPVSRAKLLAAKAIVSTALVWAATALVSGAALAAGVLLFGWHPTRLPALLPDAPARLIFGVEMSTAVLLRHVVVATAYVACGFTALIAMGTFFSTVTDIPAGAIGGAVGAYVVSEILDGIAALGTLRYGLPTHYLDAWDTMFTRNTTSHDLVAGLVVQLAYLVVFGILATWWFQRRDIRS